MRIFRIAVFALSLLLAVVVLAPNAFAQDDTDGDGILDIDELPIDSDGDGLLNYLDDDDDGDGIPTRVEGAGDQDSDGVANYLDTDSDGDSVPDATEAGYDSDADGVPDYLDDDDDGDGIPTLVEGTDDVDFDGSPNYVDDDSDGDGVLDSVEGTNDTDSDGSPDYVDPDDDGDGILTWVEGVGDQDSDGVANYLDTDSDGDSVPDATEAGYDSDADGVPDFLDDDDDNDGIPTLVEGTADGDFDGSPNYIDDDSDGDGILDAVEGAGDQDSDGVANFLDDDSDGDSVPDATEAGYDTDADGVPDFLDDDDDNDGIPTIVEGTADGDGDGSPNYVDTDSDDDGYLDAVEAAAGSDPYDPLSTPFSAPQPTIVSIGDVGNDQGRRVRIGWTRSTLDATGSLTPILSYSIYRRVDGNKAGAPGAVAHAKAAGTWDFVRNLPATGESSYSTLAGTLCDSTEVGMCWSVFFVRAHTAAPTVFHDSEPDSGYSVDNLAPNIPVGLTVAYGADNALNWQPSLDEDFRYFRIYRGEAPGFTPDAAHLVQTVTAAEWLDPAAGYGVHYVVSAVDFAGNESPVAVPLEISAVGDNLPQVAMLEQNSPNPFNPSTTISFALAESEAVTLVIHDLGGRLVRTLLDGEVLARGNRSVAWDGRDAGGRSVGAGAYFYSIRTATFQDTKRMLLIK